MKYIVKLTPNEFWLLHVKSGDPGRTTLEDNAQRFKSKGAAQRALNIAKQLPHRNYENAEILEVKT